MPDPPVSKSNLRAMQEPGGGLTAAIRLGALSAAQRRLATRPARRNIKRSEHHVRLHLGLMQRESITCNKLDGERRLMNHLHGRESQPPTDVSNGNRTASINCLACHLAAWRQRPKALLVLAQKA